MIAAAMGAIKALKRFGALCAAAVTMLGAVAVMMAVAALFLPVLLVLGVVIVLLALAMFLLRGHYPKGVRNEEEPRG